MVVKYFSVLVYKWKTLRYITLRLMSSVSHYYGISALLVGIDKQTSTIAMGCKKLDRCIPTLAYKASSGQQTKALIT